jgi:tripartite-type tricarboxylate transporter receptor subunit TctC
VLAPAKTPKDVTAQLATWFKAAMQAPDVRSKLANLGLYPVGTCLDEFTAHINKKMTNTVASSVRRTYKANDPRNESCMKF